MLIKNVRVENFRSIRDQTLPCDRLTAIVGPNGSGKSSFLRALELFYSAVARYGEQDFYAGDTSREIRVTVIAAGFPSSNPKKTLFETRETPAIERENREINNGGVEHVKKIDNDESMSKETNELEEEAIGVIPAFLRRSKK